MKHLRGADFEKVGPHNLISLQKAKFIKLLKRITIM